MRLMRFNAKAEYAPGKTLVIADTLSRSPGNDRDNTTEEIIACHVNAVTHCWPASQSKMDMIRSATWEDEQLQRVMRLIKEGWPDRVSSVRDDIKDYYTVKNSLSTCEGLVTLGCCKVIPQSMRQDILEIRVCLNAGSEQETQCGGLRYPLTLKTGWRRATVVR